MTMRLLSLLGSILVLLSSPCAWAGGLRVTLSPSNQIVKQGDKPRLTVQVTAVGAPLRIMRFAHRRDLLDNYAKIRVAQRGQNVDVPVEISDPGTPNDSDYELLRPGQSTSFEHRGTPLVLQKLQPGSYKATVVLQPDWRVGGVVSNSVSFRVISN